MAINLKMVFSKNKSKSISFEIFILQACKKRDTTDTHTHFIIGFSFDHFGTTMCVYDVCIVYSSSGWDVGRPFVSN